MSSVSGFSNNGSVPSLASSLGFNSNANYGIQSPTSTQPKQTTPTSGVLAYNPSQNMSLASQSPYAGMIPGKTTTVSPTGSTTTTHAPVSNQSVLAQQKMLNKTYNAGLVEDGISGPKTQSAIAQYLTGSSSGTTKAPDDPSNEYNTATGAVNTKYSGYINPTPPGPQSAPQVSSDPMENAQNLSNAGGQSQNEYDTQQRLIQLGAGASPEYQAAQDEAKRVSDNSVQYAKDYSGLTNNIAGTAGFLTQQTGNQGLLNNQYNTVQNTLSNQYAGATNRLGAANTQQGLLNQAAGTAYSGAQTQAGRGLSAQGDILTASLPGQQGTSSQLYNPLGGVQGGNSVVSGANRQSAYDLTQQKNEIQSVFNGAEANFKLLVDTAKQGGVNDTNVPAINAIQQAVSKGLASSSAVINFQNTLATVRSQYAQIFGGGTATVDSQNRAEQAIPPNISLGALQSLEQQLKSEAVNRINGIDQEVKSLTSGSSSNSSASASTPSGGSIYNF